ncbi:MAG: hypothetical protein ACTSYS_00605 [Promethearchaeota archaeon]
MVEYKLIPPSYKWHKKVLKLADEYNKFVKKKKNEKIEEVLIKIEDGIIQEKDQKIRKDFAYLVQLIEERHDESIFHPDILNLEDYLLGGKAGGDDQTLVFRMPGEDPVVQSVEEQKESKEQFNIETIDLDRIELINLEKITPSQLEKPTQKCAFGDGQVLDEKGQPLGNIWRCKACGTVYHENCLRVCLLTKGSCIICDKPYLKE